jgi:hypothetical protein
MPSGTFRHTMHEFIPGFLMVTVAELLEIGFAVLAVIALAVMMIIC